MTVRAVPRFKVESVTPYKDGFGLIGRCMAGPIKVGDVFVLALGVIAEPNENRHKEVIGAIHLTVHEIQYFNKSVSELPVSHSGGLYVLGIGVELLGSGCEIEGA